MRLLFAILATTIVFTGAGEPVLAKKKDCEVNCKAPKSPSADRCRGQMKFC